MAEFILTFHTTHDALNASKVCNDAGITHKKIPTPRALSSECGFVVQLEPIDDKTIGGFINSSALQYDTLYRINQDNNTMTYIKCSLEDLL